MARYIDADILRKNEVARCHCVPCVGSNDNNYKDLDEVLNDCPTADVAPRSEVVKVLNEVELLIIITKEAYKQQMEDAPNALSKQSKRTRPQG